MAVCSRYAGSGPYVPPEGSFQQPTPMPPTPMPPALSSGTGAAGCTPPENLSPEERGSWYQTYVLSGRIRCPGGYNPCDNPDAPSWCSGPVQAPRSVIPCSNYSLNQEGFITPVQYNTDQPAPPLQPGQYRALDRQYANSAPNQRLRIVCVTNTNNPDILMLTTPDGTFQLSRIADLDSKGYYVSDGYGGQRWMPGEKLSQYHVKIISFAKGRLLRGGARVQYDTIAFDKQTNNGGRNAYYYSGESQIRSETWFPYTQVR
jgi:hypothetical protein